MKFLDNVSLVAVATKEVKETAHALEYSQKGIGFKEVHLMSHFDPMDSQGKYQFKKIEPFSSVGEWGRFVVFELHKFIKTDFIILIHADGFIVNSEKWTDDFLNYDYIGAPFPIPKDQFSYRDYYGNIIRVGNSVSLRSKRLLSLPSTLNLDWGSADHGFFHEDGFLCVQNRHILTQNGIKYPPLDIACQFSREQTLPENKHIEPFAFHKWYGKNRNYPCFGTKETLLTKTYSKLRKKFL